MSDPVFFRNEGPFTLAALAPAIEARLHNPAQGDIAVRAIAALDQAGPDELSFLDNPHYVGPFRQTKAGACIVAARFVDQAPDGVALLIASSPYQAFARAAALFFPQALRGTPAWGAVGVATGAHVHPTARLEHGVTVEPGAVIGAAAEIGAGTLIAAGAVIAANVRIGRQCDIGSNASVQHALIGNRVIIHPGVRIGQDGFGFALSAEGHRKVPQVGRVIVQDDVEIGANTTIDRGATRDTVIGEGSKIDNLVQIGHNVIIGRHCIIVAQTGISGSCELADFVAIGGQAGLTGHLKVGTGAQIAASSRVKDDVPAGARWGGAPAKPVREWFREVETLRRLALAPAPSRGGGKRD